ncbi:hypothetical protein RZS08_51990, partial [Arthrospira platensis SPKY1]|nr:hypothetical protein [Arthrospira platensis SPKY1]
MPQVFQLCGQDGLPIGPLCHDLELGAYNQVLYRTLEEHNPVWQVAELSQEGTLSQVEEFGPLNPPTDFPFLGQRDTHPLL